MTKSQKAFQDRVRALGCIVCHGNGVDSPCEIHHLLRGGRRIGEDSVLGLCQIHHRGQINTELLEKTRELCGEPPVQT
jgi:hypothetical protein